MNDKIKELAEQADDFTDNKIQMQGEYHPDWHDIRDQKFAQLIVEECIDYCGENLSKTVGGALKIHFGVEKPQGWVCPKCGTDRTKAVCPKGHHAALTGDCPIVGVTQ